MGNPEDSLVPDWDLPSHLKSSIVPPEDLPAELKTADIPPRDPVTAPATPESAPVAMPQLTADQVMEMIAQRLSGPIKTMYDADITRGMPHDDAMLRVLDTMDGQAQCRTAYRDIMREMMTPSPPSSSNSPA